MQTYMSFSCRPKLQRNLQSIYRGEESSEQDANNAHIFAENSSSTNIAFFRGN
jgi:hypothetical protein